MINRTAKMGVHSRWIKMLYEIGNPVEFSKILATSKSQLLGIMQYRKLLHSQNKSNVSYIEIDSVHKQMKLDKLHKLLEKLFLEPITESQFQFALEKLNSTENGLAKMCKMHMQNKNARMLNVILRL